MIELYLTVVAIFLFLCLVFFIERPHDALLFIIYLNLLWPNYIVYKVGILPGMTPPRIMLLLLIVALYLILSINKNYRSRFMIIFYEFRSIFFVSMMIIFVQFISSLFYSSNLQTSIFSIINDFLMGPLFIIIILLLLDNKSGQKKLFWTLIIALISINIIGLKEYFNNGPLFSNYIISETLYTTIQSKARGGTYRLMSVFTNSLVYSQILVMSIPLYIYAFINSKKFLKVSMLINLCLTIFLLRNTGSRAAVALIAIFPIIYLYSKIYFKSQKEITKYTLIIGFGMLVISVIAYTAINQKNFVTLTTTGTDSSSAVSTQERIRQFEVGIPALLEHPLLGYGVGGGVKLMYPRTSIDNLYLTIALNTGITGLFLFLFFNYLILKQTFKVKLFNTREMYIYISITLILLFFLILSIDTMMTIYYILVAMIMHSTRKVTFEKGKI